LQRTVKQFQDDCSDSKSDPELLRREARLLYDWLISPIARRLDPSRALIAELDGPLSDLPIQALMAESGSYLGDALRIVQSPGLLYLHPFENDTAISSLAHALVIGAPTPAHNEFGLTSSTDTGQEAIDVAKLFTDAKLIKGQDATRYSLERNLPGAVVFHFAGHAFVSSQGTALVLANGANDGSQLSTYNADLVRPAHFRICRLAVLAACGTAKAEEDGLSDPHSLVRAFLRVGVPHVVASHWEVDSAATSDFMRAFYRRLLAGKQVSVAVQEAAVEIRSKPGMSHPYYWAAFTAFGGM
jgi:CHAT domain-containing protein